LKIDGSINYHLMAKGKLQIEGEVIHVIFQECYNLPQLLAQLLTSQSAVASAKKNLSQKEGNLKLNHKPSLVYFN